MVFSTLKFSWRAIVFSDCFFETWEKDCELDSSYQEDVCYFHFYILDKRFYYCAKLTVLRNLHGPSSSNNIYITNMSGSS